MEPELSYGPFPSEEERLELLSAYLDGLTSPEEALRVEAWLRGDPISQDLYRQLYAIQQSLHQSGNTTSAQQAEALVSEIWNQVSPSGWQRYGLPSALAAGAIAALTGLLGPSEANLVVVSPTAAPPPDLGRGSRQLGHFRSRVNARGALAPSTSAPPAAPPGR